MGWAPWTWGDDSDKAAAAADADAKRREALATEQRAYIEKARGEGLAGYDKWQGTYDSLYGPGGQGAGPGALERFYADSGNKDFFAYERGQRENAINSQMQARGGFNSGAALAAQAQGQAGFDSDLLRYRGQLAGGAQQAQQQRLGQQFGAQGAISQGRAGYGLQGANQAAGLYQGNMADASQARYAADIHRANKPTFGDVLPGMISGAVQGGMMGGPAGAAAGAGAGMFGQQDSVGSYYAMKGLNSGGGGGGGQPSQQQSLYNGGGGGADYGASAWGQGPSANSAYAGMQQRPWWMQ